MGVAVDRYRPVVVVGLLAKWRRAERSRQSQIVAANAAAAARLVRCRRRALVASQPRSVAGSRFVARKGLVGCRRTLVKSAPRVGRAAGAGTVVGVAGRAVCVLTAQVVGTAISVATAIVVGRSVVAAYHIAGRSGRRAVLRVARVAVRLFCTVGRVGRDVVVSPTDVAAE